MSIYVTNLAIVLNTLPFGIGVAASTRVGHLIGFRSPIGAKNAAHASALLSITVGTVVMLAMIAFEDASQSSYFE